MVAKVTIVCEPVTAENWTENSADEEAEGHPPGHDDVDDEFVFLCNMLLTFIPEN